MTTCQVRRARRIIARDVRRYGACPALAVRHHWTFDGYFWHHCRNCGEVN